MKGDRWLRILTGLVAVLALVSLVLTLRNLRDTATAKAQAAAKADADNRALLEQIKALVAQDSDILAKLGDIGASLVTETSSTAALSDQIKGVVDAIQAAQGAQGAMLSRLQAQARCAALATSQAAAGRCFTGSLAPAPAPAGTHAAAAPSSAKASPTAPPAPAPSPAPQVSPARTCKGKGKKGC